MLGVPLFLDQLDKMFVLSLPQQHILQYALTIKTVCNYGDLQVKE